MRSDAALLGEVPDFVRFDAMLKATPLEEGGRRIVYLEASDESTDLQNEQIMQKALEESSAYFLRHGNIDLSHYTIMGARSGFSNYLEFEIGKPVDVRVSGKATFVKCELYSGSSPQAKNADMVWSSMTAQTPPSRWYPSVGGAVLAKSIKLDPRTNQKVAVVTKVRWNNIALDRCPVNVSVGEASTAPLGTFAKAFGGFVLNKSLEMGHGTDVAALSGGGALQMQSLDGVTRAYHSFRDRLASHIRAGSIPSMQPDALAQAAQTFGLTSERASEYVNRFLSDLKQPKR